MGILQSRKIQSVALDNKEEKKDSSFSFNHEIYPFFEQKSAQQFTDFIESCHEDGLFDDIEKEFDYNVEYYFDKDGKTHILKTTACRFPHKAPPKDIRQQCYC